SSTEQSAPIAAASVGEAQPSRIDPSTAKIMKTGGIRLVEVIQSLRANGGSSGSGGILGPIRGLTTQRIRMYVRYSAPMSRPGNTMPYIRSPTDRSASGPMTITTTDGGMMVPSEPPAQMVPLMRPLL